MFFSLNKKILYSLLGFLALLAVIFFAIFINLYAQKLQENRNEVYMRNQYVVNLLHNNIRLQQQLAQISDKYPVLFEEENFPKQEKNIDAVQQELSNEQKLTEELYRNYNSNYEAIVTGAKFFGVGMLLVVLLIFVLLVLLDFWVIAPIEKLIKISHNVSAGDFSSRVIPVAGRYFRDEYDILYDTFNKMLDSTEENIKQTQNRERFLQQLIDAIPEGIRVIDQNYDVIMVNKSFYNIFNVKDSCVGKKCYEAYGYDCEGCSQSIYRCPIKYIMQDKKDSLNTIHEVGKLPLYVTAVKLPLDNDADKFYIVEAIHDLSADVRFSHQQKVSSLAFLSTSVAHEMKNNLGAIRLIMEGILNDEYKDVPDNDEQKKYLLMAYKQLVETVKMPERLLKLAQYSENEVGDVDVASAVKDMMLMIDYDAKRHGINIVTDIEPNLIFSGNESDFKMIILNLSQNAIKAMPEGGELRISASKSKRLAVINVSDTGIGIGEEQIKHIFEPFYSVNNKVKSSGLGLAIVNSLVIKGQGSVSVKSKEGKGTRFTIKFPLNAKENDL